MKKIILLISCLIIIGMQLKAQNSKFSLGVMSSLDFCKMKFNSSITNEAYYSSITNFPGYHIGIKAQYDFNDKVSLRSGVNFMKSKFGDYFYWIWDPMPDDNLYYDYSITVPLMIGYTVFSFKNFKITPSAGCILSYKYEYKNISSDKNYTYTNIYYPSFKVDYKAAQLNLGFEYLLKNKILITIEPYIYHAFVDKKNMIFYSDFTYGGILSINYKF